MHPLDLTENEIEIGDEIGVFSTENEEGNSEENDEKRQLELFCCGIAWPVEQMKRKRIGFNRFLDNTSNSDSQ